MPKEQEIAKGVFMSKRKKKIKDELFYIIEIRLTLFKNLNFNINLEGSNNVEIIDSDTLEKQIIVPFQTTTEVVRIKLNKGWTLKTKFKFSYTFPSFEEQQQHLRKYEYQKNSSIQQSHFLDNIEFKSFQENQISTFLDKKNQKFIDHDFLPNEKSLGFGDQKQQFDKFECIIHWRRIEEIQNQEEEEQINEIILENIYPHNITLGLLNNHWFLSALMCIAENPKLIKRLFKTKNKNKQNFYCLKIGYMGIWNETIIDDFVPCYPLEEPIFGNTDNNEPWVLLIEKCYAKMFKKYKLIEKGEFKNALLDLTCAPLFTYQINDDFLNNQNLIKNIIKEALEKYWIVSVQVRKVSSLENHVDQELFEYGFYISRLEYYNNEYIVEIKNNWNLFEWNGLWSEEDTQRWTSQSIEELQPDFENQNTFWMNLDDLQKNFQVIHICKTQVWNELRQKGKFVQAIEIDNEQIQHFCSRWAYGIKIQKKDTIIIGLHQEDENIIGVKENRPYLDIGIAIINFKNGIYKLIDYKDCEIQRQIFLEIQLDIGEYIIVPYCTGLNLKNYNKKVKEIDLQDEQLLLLIENYFQKYDIKNKGYLNKQEFMDFCQIINTEYDEFEFEEMCEQPYIENQNEQNIEGIIQKKFKDFILQKLHKSSEEEQYEILEKMGYEKSFFSLKSRLFVISIHSKYQTLFSVQDSLSKKYDYLINNLISKKNGKEIYNKNNIKVFCYINMYYKKKQLLLFIQYYKLK